MGASDSGADIVLVVSPPAQAGGGAQIRSKVRGARSRCLRSGISLIFVPPSKVDGQLLRALSTTRHIGTFAKLPVQEISTRSCLANSPAVDAWRSPGASVGNEGPGALSGPVRTILPAGTLTPPQSTHLQSRPARIPDQVSTAMHSRIRKRVSRGPIGRPPCFAWAKCDYEDGRHGMEQGRDRDDMRPE